MDLGVATTFLFDFDGTLWYGDDPVPGAAELLRTLRQSDREVVIVSNNSQLCGNDIAMQVESRLGTFVPAVTVVDIAAPYLERNGFAGRTRIVGSPVLKAACETVASGSSAVRYDSCDAVLVGCTPEFSYQDIRDIANAGERGACLIATNPDGYRPHGDGSRIPETGSLVAAIKEVTSAPWAVLGKPEAYLLQQALRQAGSTRAEAVMIGDGLYTDVLGSNRIGMRSVWISSTSKPKDGPEPDLQLSRLSDIGLQLPTYLPH